MPRVKGLPTPINSTDITARDQSFIVDMASAFTLPPPAFHTAIETPKTTKVNVSTASMNMNGHQSPPPSPEDKVSGSKLQRKRTLSGGTKSATEVLAMASAAQNSSNTTTTNHDLPPPPSRARKIIHMKPKQSPHLTAQDQSLSASSSSTTKTSITQSNLATSSSKKAKSQPSATSAAGRKIARKTAHSIIERRRRSKMNEEFGVLKDMIPACDGVEMHKLAILQAGIEYLRYLEGCITKLKDRNQQLEDLAGEGRVTKRDDDMEVDDETEQEGPDISRPGSTPMTEESISSQPQHTLHAQTRLHYARDARISPSIANPSAVDSAFTSPNLRPISSSASAYSASRRPSQAQMYTTLPPLQTHPRHSYAHSLAGDDRSVPTSPLIFHSQSATTSRTSTRTNSTPTATPFGTLATGISPAIHAFHFSPEMTRGSTYAASTPGTGMSAFSVPGHSTAYDGRHSPHIAPLPQAALPLPSSSFMAVNSAPNEKPGHAEVTATAALLMMGHDRRTSISHPNSHDSKESGRSEAGKKESKGMSVRDLLSS